MGVIIYSFNLNISPKMSCGMLECDIFVVLQNDLLLFCNKIFYSVKDFVTKRGGICAGPCILGSASASPCLPAFQHNRTACSR